MNFSHLSLIRAQAPLIHNITHYVVMNNTANALLAVGASPSMAHAVEEVEVIVLDPVGCGNASTIRAHALRVVSTKGMDSLHARERKDYRP